MTGAMAGTALNYIFAELYQARGVRRDIGVDASINDDIFEGNSMNDFGRKLMQLNYFLEPGTGLK